MCGRSSVKGTLAAHISRNQCREILILAHMSSQHGASVSRRDGDLR